MTKVNGNSNKGICEKKPTSAELVPRSKFKRKGVLGSRNSNDKVIKFYGPEVSELVLRLGNSSGFKRTNRIPLKSFRYVLIKVIFFYLFNASAMRNLPSKLYPTISVPAVNSIN